MFKEVRKKFLLELRPETFSEFIEQGRPTAFRLLWTAIIASPYLILHWLFEFEWNNPWSFAAVAALAFMTIKFSPVTGDDPSERDELAQRIRMLEIGAVRIEAENMLFVLESTIETAEERARALKAWEDNPGDDFMPMGAGPMREQAWSKTKALLTYMDQHSAILAAEFSVDQPASFSEAISENDEVPSAAAVRAQFTRFETFVRGLPASE